MARAPELVSTDAVSGRWGEKVAGGKPVFNLILTPVIPAPRPLLSTNSGLAGGQVTLPRPRQFSYPPTLTFRLTILEASKISPAPPSSGRRRCRHITACAAKCVREGGVRRDGEGGGWPGEGRFPGPGDAAGRLLQTRRLQGRRHGPRGSSPEPGSPEPSKGRRLGRQGLPCRLRPSPPARPALVPQDCCCKGRQRNNRGCGPLTCTRTVSSSPGRSFRALQIYRRQKRR